MCASRLSTLLRALTDVVSVLQCGAVGQAGYSQVSLSPQAIQLVLDYVLPLCQGQEGLHVVCHTHEHTQIHTGKDGVVGIHTCKTMTNTDKGYAGCTNICMY